MIKIFIFLVPPSKRGRGRTLKFKFHQNFRFLCLQKGKKFQISVYMRLGAILISARGGLKDPPPMGDRVEEAPKFSEILRSLLGTL